MCGISWTIILSIEVFSCPQEFSLGDCCFVLSFWFLFSSLLFVCMDVCFYSRLILGSTEFCNIELCVTDAVLPHTSPSDILSWGAEISFQPPLRAL